LGKKGFIAYRGTEKSRIYTGARSGGESIFKRLARLCDNYINFSGMNCYRVSELEVDFGVVNVQSSRFLRPYMPLLKFIEPLRIHRIKKQMEYAAKEGKMFHLWWHPHNFGKNTNKNMDNLREILNWYTYLRKKYGMQSMNMQEVAKERLKIENELGINK
jgi:hypothetical protein